MSCATLAASAFLWLASSGVAPIPAAPAVQSAPASVAAEPLFADIVRRASALKSRAELYRKGLGADLAAPAPTAALTDLAGFQGQIGELAALDMKGHVTLKERGAVDDLKCILRGISQDLPEKLSAMSAARTVKDLDMALRDMVYLLNDNVEVITAPPTPPA